MVDEPVVPLVNSAHSRNAQQLLKITSEEQNLVNKINIFLGENNKAAWPAEDVVPRLRNSNNDYQAVALEILVVPAHEQPEQWTQVGKKKTEGFPGTPLSVGGGKKKQQQEVRDAKAPPATRKEKFPGKRRGGGRRDQQDSRNPLSDMSRRPKSSQVRGESVEVTIENVEEGEDDAVVLDRVVDATSKLSLGANDSSRSWNHVVSGEAGRVSANAKLAETSRGSRRQGKKAASGSRVEGGGTLSRNESPESVTWTSGGRKIYAVRGSRSGTTVSTKSELDQKKRLLFRPKQSNESSSRREVAFDRSPSFPIDAVSLPSVDPTNEARKQNGEHYREHHQSGEEAVVEESSFEKKRNSGNILHSDATEEEVEEVRDQQQAKVIMPSEFAPTGPAMTYVSSPSLRRGFVSKVPVLRREVVDDAPNHPTAPIQTHYSPKSSANLSGPPRNSPIHSMSSSAHRHSPLTAAMPFGDAPATSGVLTGATLPTMTNSSSLFKSYRHLHDAPATSGRAHSPATDSLPPVSAGLDSALSTAPGNAMHSTTTTQLQQQQPSSNNGSSHLPYGGTSSPMLPPYSYQPLPFVIPHFISPFVYDTMDHARGVVPQYWGEPSMMVWSLPGPQQQQQQQQPPPRNNNSNSGHHVAPNKNNNLLAINSADSVPPRHQLHPDKNGLNPAATSATNSPSTSNSASSVTNPSHHAYAYASHHAPPSSANAPHPSNANSVASAAPSNNAPPPTTFSTSSSSTAAHLPYAADCNSAASSHYIPFAPYPPGVILPRSYPTQPFPSPNLNSVPLGQPHPPSNAPGFTYTHSSYPYKAAVYHQYEEDWHSHKTVPSSGGDGGNQHTPYPVLLPPEHTSFAPSHTTNPPSYHPALPHAHHPTNKGSILNAVEPLPGLAKVGYKPEHSSFMLQPGQCYPCLY